MWKYVWLIVLIPMVAYASPELSAAIDSVRLDCGGISAELDDMKKMAGINTAVTAVGTVAGGVALGTGIAKAGVDKKATELEEKLNKLREMAKTQDLTNLAVFDWNDFVKQHAGDNKIEMQNEISQAERELAEQTKKSKNLGNWRTGTLAAATATNIAGAVIAGNNRVRGDLKSQIDECLMAVKTLSNVRMQARISQSATDAELQHAENIVRACDEWSTVDISPINNRATGAAVSSGIGAGLGLAGTIASASANSEPVRRGDEKKEKNLNTAANVLAGGTTVASGVATIFNATQINAIKRAATVADQCEGALR